MFPFRCLGVFVLIFAKLHAFPAFDSPIQDHAILQRDIPLPIMGTSLPNANVTVTFQKQSKIAKADDQGNWKVILDPLKAEKLSSVHQKPTGYSLSVSAQVGGGQMATKTVKDLVVGDVWLCAGQSNMAGKMRTNTTRHFPVDSIAKANFPGLRHWISGSDSPWLVCSPETASEFKKVAFFFGRRLQEDALVPIGLISAAVGGSNIESWLNQAPHQTGKNYTKLIEPIEGYGIRGVLWYQGESNARDKRAYQPKLEALIKGWRSAWKRGDLPFYYVQLPGIGQSPEDNPAQGDGRAEIRQAAVETLALKNTGLAVTIDIGDQREHPPNKYDTGVRLARLALRQSYGVENIPLSPLYQKHEIRGNKVHLSFSEAGSGLMIAEKTGFLQPVEKAEARIKWLSIQAKDGTWHWADASIDGATLIVSSPKVSEPVAVRYAYTNHPTGPLLYNKEGQPVGPFSTIGYGPESKD